MYSYFSKNSFYIMLCCAFLGNCQRYYCYEYGTSYGFVNPDIIISCEMSKWKQIKHLQNYYEKLPHVCRYNILLITCVKSYLFNLFLFLVCTFLVTQIRKELQRDFMKTFSYIFYCHDYLQKPVFLKL